MKVDSSLLILAKAEVPITYLGFQFNGSPNHSVNAMSLSMIWIQWLRFLIDPVCTAGLTLFTDGRIAMIDAYRKAFSD